MIEVVVDDLAFLEVDAVLRPANHTLDPASTAAAQLDRVAGAAFVTQRQVSTPLEVGSAVVTGAGELASQFVIHLVISSDEINADRNSVTRALSSAWNQAAEWELSTVATPLVGAGAGQLPPEDAAQLLADSLEQSRHDPDFPRSVRLVVESEDDRKRIDDMLRRRVS